MIKSYDLELLDSLSLCDLPRQFWC
uniref:Uncharacterized protein n=1 Tax=Arundo donax TaxID=35708 RepID=A0A0A9EFP6_ARUDO